MKRQIVVPMTRSHLEELLGSKLPEGDDYEYTVTIMPDPLLHAFEDAIVKWLQEGQTNKMIRLKFAASYRTIDAIRKKYRLIGKRGRKPTIKIASEDFEKMTLKAIAEKYMVSIATVQRHKKQWELTWLPTDGAFAPLPPPPASDAAVPPVVGETTAEKAVDGATKNVASWVESVLKDAYKTGISGTSKSSGPIVVGAERHPATDRYIVASSTGERLFVDGAIVAALPHLVKPGTPISAFHLSK